MTVTPILLWSPHHQSRDFLYVNDSVVRLYTWHSSLDTTQRPGQTLVSVYDDPYKIESISWSPDSHINDLVAIAVAGGNVSLLRLSQYRRGGGVTSTIHTPLTAATGTATTEPNTPSRNNLGSGEGQAGEDTSGYRTSTGTNNGGLKLTVTHGRHCHVVSFSPYDPRLLGVGLARHRNEHGLLVWDIEQLLASKINIDTSTDATTTTVDPTLTTLSGHPSPDPMGALQTISSPALFSSVQQFLASPNTTPRLVKFTSSNPRNAGADKPSVTHSFKESVSSMAWLGRNTLLVGGTIASKRELYLYDLRQQRVCSRVETSAILDLQPDPFDRHRFASCTSSGGIQVWDSRNMARELLYIPVQHNEKVVAAPKLGFSPHRRGVLAGLDVGQDFISMHYLQTNQLVTVPSGSSGEATTATINHTTASTHAPAMTTKSSSSIEDIPDDPAGNNSETFLWRTRYIRTEPSTALGTFAWIPSLTAHSQRYRIITANVSGNLESRKIEEIPRVCWNAQGALAVAGENYNRVFSTPSQTTEMEPNATDSLAAMQRALDMVTLGSHPVKETDNNVSLVECGHPPTTSSRGVGLAVVPPQVSTTMFTKPSEDRSSLYARRTSVKRPESDKNIDKPTLTTSSHPRIISWKGATLPEEQTLVKSLQSDIAVVMRQWATQGYGMDPEHNLSIIGNDRQRREAWTWIQDAVTLADDQDFVADNARLGFMGIQKVFRELSKRDYSALKVKQTEYESQSGSEPIYPGTDLNVQRKLALRIAGCHYSPGRLEETIQQIEHRGEFEQAAAWALFHGRRERCTATLAKSGKKELEMLAMALSAHASRVVDRANQVYMDQWRAMNRKFMRATTNPYLKAIFKYYYNEDWSDVLSEQELSMKERLSIALRFLDDQKLLTYVNENTQAAINQGNLEGLVLTGLTDRHMPLLAKFIDLTADVQTAALISSFAPVPPNPPSVKDLCVESYRDLLDQWEMYETRANFDIERGKWMRRYQIAPSPLTQTQLIVRCTYCNSNLMQDLNTVSSGSGGGGPGSRTTSGLDRDSNRLFPSYSSTNRFDSGVAGDKSMQCPVCKAALPSCPICLLSLGTPANICMDNPSITRTSNASTELNPFDWWFMWCQTCRHGGHQKHLTEWFETHKVCPVADCMCHCRELD
ncbi:hypothetical protein IWQ62_000559 [Dispira parvispora]|uniref:WD repeat protein mio zinc-ribbon like domain-containing protein n=1 Tax=Dispira parvispora TaxID=1520584 RepID=A0A9W8AUJ6_9FUNG|nr:hypothetical protein IWQ62_000559 [Dispira parvispora]